MVQAALDDSIALVQGVSGDFFVPRGGDLFDELRETGGHFRPETAMLLARVAAGMQVIDLGAGVGTFAVPLQRAVGPAGRVWCFEPDPTLFRLLRWNLALNGVGHQARAAPGEEWPDLDEWRLSAGVAGIDVVRVDGLRASGALAGGGAATLEACRPVVFVTEAAGSWERGGGADALEQVLLGLSYRFYRNNGIPSSATDAFEEIETRAFARTSEGFGVLATGGSPAVPAGEGGR